MMPIYEFVCQDCGYEFEKIQSFSDSSTPVCPNCQGLHVQRRLSAPAIHFKGSGWYITDSKKAAKGSATGSSGGSAGEAGKSDTKSETGKSEAGKGETGKSETTKGETQSAGAKGDTSAAASAAPAAKPAD
jgi:putative FmdB family regulatory protein